MESVQRPYRALLDLLARPFTRWPHAVRHLAIGICFVLINTNYILIGSGALYEMTGLLKTFSGVMLVGLIVFAAKTGNRPLSLPKAVMIPWLAVGLIVLISSLIVSLDYLSTAVTFLVLVPLFWLSWGNSDDKEGLLRTMTVAAYVSFGILVLTCLINPSYLEGRFRGVFANANALGQVLTVYIPLFLFAFEQARSRWERVLSLVFACAAFWIICLTQTRTSFVCVAAVVVVWLIFRITQAKKNLPEKTFRRSMIAAIVLLLSAIISFGFLAANDVRNGRQPFEGTVVGRFLEGGDIESFTAGRWDVWKAYVAEFNLQGHALDYIWENNPHYTYQDGDSVTPLTQQITAHNSYIQITYENGIFAGIAYTITVLAVGIYGFVLLLRKDTDTVKLILFFMLFTGFFLQGLFESCYVLFSRMPALYFFTMMFVLFPPQGTEHELPDTQSG